MRVNFSGERREVVRLVLAWLWSARARCLERRGKETVGGLILKG